VYKRQVLYSLIKKTKYLDLVFYGVTNELLKNVSLSQKKIGKKS